MTTACRPQVNCPQQQHVRRIGQCFAAEEQDGQELYHDRTIKDLPTLFPQDAVGVIKPHKNTSGRGH